MTSSSTTRQRHVAVVAVALALLAAVCALLFAPAKPGSVASAASPSASAPTAGAAAAPASAGSPVSVASPESPSSPDDGAGTGGDADAVAGAPGAVWGAGDDAPGCHPSKDRDSPLPSGRAGAAETQTPAFVPCPEPASQEALGAAHAAPPVHGPTPITPPSPVGLSVLRV